MSRDAAIDLLSDDEGSIDKLLVSGGSVFGRRTTVAPAPAAVPSSSGNHSTQNLLSDNEEDDDLFQDVETFRTKRPWSPVKMEAAAKDLSSADNDDEKPKRPRPVSLEPVDVKGVMETVDLLDDDDDELEQHWKTPLALERPTSGPDVKPSIPLSSKTLAGTIDLTWSDDDDDDDELLNHKVSFRPNNMPLSDKSESGPGQPSTTPTPVRSTEPISLVIGHCIVNMIGSRHYQVPHAFVAPGEEVLLIGRTNEVVVHKVVGGLQVGAIDGEGSKVLGALMDSVAGHVKFAAKVLPHETLFCCPIAIDLLARPGLTQAERDALELKARRLLGIKFQEPVEVQSASSLPRHVAPVSALGATPAIEVGQVVCSKILLVEGTRFAQARLNEEVFVARDRHNRYDSNAVRVVSLDGVPLGYVATDTSAVFTRILYEYGGKFDVKGTICRTGDGLPGVQVSFAVKTDAAMDAVDVQRRSDNLRRDMLSADASKGADDVAWWWASARLWRWM